MILAQTVNRWRIALSGLAAALMLTVLIGTPQGRTATAQFLAQFRSQRFAVVTIDDPSQGKQGLEQLEHLGTIQGGYRGKSGQQVQTIAEASRLVGFEVKQPAPATLPAGLEKTPRILVVPASELRFTFDRDKARSYFQSIGHPEVGLPDKFHGAALVMWVPSAVLLQYDGADDSPGLLIGQSQELAVDVEGNVSFDELRDFLLKLPGLPPETVRQLREIKDWRNTLPIPVPANQIQWRQATIAGGQGLILADNSGIGSAAIWQRDGRVYGVAGTVKATEIQRVADSLR